MRIDHRLLILIILLTAGCSSPPGEGVPDSHALETSVAATLAGRSTPEPASPQPSPAATQTPTPAPTTASQEGPQVVYTDSGNVWIVRPGSAPAQLSSTGDVIDVRISDDGLQVVYVRRPSGEGMPVEVRAMSSDGSDDRALILPTDFDRLYTFDEFPHDDLASLAFVPGTQSLLLNTRALPEGPGLVKYNDLLSLDLETGTLTILLAPGQGGDFYPSPDGTRAAIVRPDSISMAKIDASEMRSELITYTPVITYSEFRYYAQPVWSLDSGAMAVAIPSQDPLGPNPSGTVWRVPVDGEPAQLGTIQGDLYFTQVFTAPSVSPNHDQLAFQREAAADGTRELYLAQMDGSREQRYATDRVQWSGWSPPGAYFVFSQGDQFDLQLGRPGAPPTPLVDGTDLRWLDGESFVYLSGSSGNWTVNLGRVDGSSQALASPGGDFVRFDAAD